MYLLAKANEQEGWHYPATGMAFGLSAHHTFFLSLFPLWRVALAKARFMARF